MLGYMMGNKEFVKKNHINDYNTQQVTTYKNVVKNILH